MQSLLQRWRDRADSYDTAASGYNRKCIAVKGVQLQLRAKEVRKCAEELEHSLNEQGSNAQAADSNARPAAIDRGDLDENLTCSQASLRQATSESQ